MSRKALLLITAFAEGGLFLLGWVLTEIMNLEVWSKFNISLSATALALLLCIPMSVLLFFFDRSNWEPMVRFRREVEEKITPIFSNSELPDLAFIALLAGAGEELFFRGWLQSLLANRFEPWIGILIASAIFGLLHYLSSTYAIYAGLTGLYLGVIYQVYGNLYIVMAIHALYDFIALVYLLKQERHRDEPLQTLE